MVITQMLVIFFISGPMSYIYVSYTNVVLIAGLILGPTSAALYTVMITGLMYLYFSAIRTDRLDMLLLSELPYGAEMEMVATQACFIFTGLTVSYFIVRQSRLHNQMVKEQLRTQQTLLDLQQAETRNAVQAKQDATIGWMGQQFIQTEYPQAFFETTLPKVFDTISIDHLLITCPINQSNTVLANTILASKDTTVDRIHIQFLEDNVFQEAIANHDSESIQQLLQSNIAIQDSDLINIHLQSPENPFDRTCTLVTISKERLENVHTLGTLTNMFTAVLQRAQIESQLRQFQKMDTLNRIAGSVAHDFNNLLMSIMSSTDFAFSQVEQDQSLHDTLLQIRLGSERGKSTHSKTTVFFSLRVVRPAIRLCIRCYSRNDSNHQTNYPRKYHFPYRLHRLQPSHPD